MSPPNPSAVYAFEVSVKGTEWSSIVNARTAGRAKSEVFQSVREAWDSIPFTAMRARKVGDGSPYTSEAFINNAWYRGIPGMRCGQRVAVGEGRGVVTGHNSSANLNVLFDDDSPKYSGLTLNCHPDSVKVIE